MKSYYSMVIEWSDKDQAFIVSLPEFGPYASTHGETYAEASRMGQEALESLIQVYQEEGRVLPPPLKYGGKRKFGIKRPQKKGIRRRVRHANTA